MKALDLFRGPGGWSTAARTLGIEELGVENSAIANETAAAAGHELLHEDVWEMDAVLDRMDFGENWGLIASPPCPTFSQAGKGEGRKALEEITEELVSGAWEDTPIDEYRGRFSDERTGLVLTPMLYAAAIGPEWIALEQVPSVLPVWEAMAAALRRIGYSAEAGILSAEQYGVAQVRKRAVLVAHRTRQVSLPTPTHSKYHQRTPSRLDDGVLPWVSMAEALGWGTEDLVGFPRLADGRGDVVVMDGKEYRARDLRPATAPNVAITEKARSWERFVSTGQQWFNEQGVKVHQERSTDLPSPTITSQSRSWVYVDRERLVDEVTPRVNNQSGTRFDLDWPADRPAPVIAGRELVTMPGANANRFNGATKSRNDGIRVTIEEAGVLQSFPADYPWRGTKTAKFIQCGNAVPPLLAAAILRQVV